MSLSMSFHMDSAASLVLYEMWMFMVGGTWVLRGNHISRAYLGMEPTFNEAVYIKRQAISGSLGGLSTAFNIGFGYSVDFALKNRKSLVG